MTDSPIPSLPLNIPPSSLAPNESPDPSIPPPKPSPSRWQKFPGNVALLILLTLFTALAAFLRFWRLDYQCYWTDESYTLGRINGSFRHLLNSLSSQGFPPGWYALLRWWTMAAEYLLSPHHWWNRFLGVAADPDVIALTPLVTRSLTALIGTLTIPAMYFLGRQFTDRKGALLVALLTAVNPYLIYYSRDIKMYPAVWLFVILNTAIFFQWQTTRKHLLWFPLYVLTGFLMTSMHSTAWFMIALQLIFLLTRPNIKWFDSPLWLLAVGIIALFPIYWYLNRSTWIVDAVNGDGEGGLNWIQDYAKMSWATLAGLPTSHLLGYLWPVFPPDEKIRGWFALGSDYDAHAATRSWPWLYKLELYTAIGFAAVMLLGLIPSRGFRRSPERRNSVTRYRFWWVGLWILIPTLCLAASWIPHDSPWYDRIWHGHNVQPIWEPRYLGFLVPAWILWLAAALRRFPTWPLRTLLILAACAASTFSALSNHLIYRNLPFQISAQIAAKYYDPEHRNSLAVGFADLNIKFPGKVLQITYELASATRPIDDRDSFRSNSYFFNHGRFDTNTWPGNDGLDFIRDEVRANRSIHTFVLTDRDGDLTDPDNRYSNESIGKLLGPRWTLVEEKTYRIHYEWRFYIYNTWRTRVWQRIPSTPRPSPPPPASSTAPATSTHPSP